MKLRILSVVIGLTSVLLTSLGLGQGETSLSLVQHYRALRGILFTAEIGPAAGMLTNLEGKYLDSIAAVLTKNLSKAKTWNVTHPQWPQAVATVRADLQRAAQDKVKDSRPSQFKRAYQEAFEQGLLRSQAETDLHELINFYDSPTGKHFRQVYDQMAKELLIGMVESQMMLNAGKRIGHPVSASDRQDLTEILGLFDEEYKIQLAIFDPGP